MSHLNGYAIGMTKQRVKDFWRTKTSAKLRMAQKHSALKWVRTLAYGILIERRRANQ